MAPEHWIAFGVLVATIVGVGSALGILMWNFLSDIRQNLTNFRTDLNRVQDRVTAVDNNFRDRVGWIEGLVAASSGPRISPMAYRWRASVVSNPEPEDAE